ncbi:Glycine-rich RNA-binding protein RZ1C [Armadillidium vulgare]|nr:Glycine-rich RNA-binding protein RZ1C [Armadillidium vulgare]
MIIFCFLIFRKLFVGGLGWDTTEKCIDKILDGTDHIINGRKVDAKKAIARTGKIFVGGIKAEMSDEDLRNFFSQFGKVIDVEVPFDKQRNLRKGFCFITFEQEQVVNELLKNPQQIINGFTVDLRKATPKPEPPMRGGMRGGRAGFFGGSRGGRYQGYSGYGPAYNYGGGGYGNYGNYDSVYSGYGNYGSNYGNGYDYNGYGGGYGIQQAAGAGLALSELILDAELKTLNVQNFSYDRIATFDPIFEKCCY